MALMRSLTTPTGNNNIALGFNAGVNLTTGSNNIDIGNAGVAGESNTIRIGTVRTRRTPLSPALAGSTVAGGIAVMLIPAVILAR